MSSCLLFKRIKAFAGLRPFNLQSIKKAAGGFPTGSLYIHPMQIFPDFKVRHQWVTS
jgi:hypothetical protein